MSLEASIMIYRFFVALCLAIGLAGCVSVPPPGLGQSDFDKYRITDVTVEGVEVVRSWPAQEEAFLQSGAADPDMASRLQSEPASNFPVLRAYFQRALDERLKAEFASQVSSIFSGPRPVRAVVRLRVFDVPSTARRVFVDNTAKMRADIDLVDASSGASILRYEGPLRTRALIGGLATGIALAVDRSDVGASQINDYVTAYRNWLLQK
jgi:hypothetical protein